VSTSSWVGRRGLLLLAGPLIVLAVGGCSDKKSKGPKIRKVQGIARKIDLANNRVSMTRIDPDGRETLLEGSIREDTEVWINGRNQKLEDIREGDRVEVYGFREGEAEEARLVATKVIVTRPRESDWKSTSQPASAQPASPATPQPQ
jgi:hypothetical protein